MSKVQTESLGRQAHGPHFALPPSQAPTQKSTPDLGALQASLESIAQSSGSHVEALSAYLNFAKNLTNAIDCAYVYRSSADRKSVMTLGTSKLFSTKERKELLLHWSSETCVKARVQLNRFEKGKETIATLPVFEDGRPVEAMTVALLVPQGQIEPFIVSLQLIATAIGAWYRKHRAAENAFAARSSSAIVELLAKCHEADNLDEAVFVAANEMQRLVQCETVAVALRRGGGRRLKIHAISGNGAVDQNSDVVRRLTEAAEESIDRQTTTVWPPLSASDRHTTRVHKQLVEHTRYQAVASCPLETEDDVLGTWLFLGQQEAIHNPTLTNIVQAASPKVASSLAMRKQADAGPFIRVKKWIHGTPKQRRTRRGVLIATLLAGVLMMIPIPHKISCDCTVEPTTRRFASVPFNGILRDSLVEPGDIVQASQVLARMDDRELRLEKKDTLASKIKTQKRYDKLRAEADDSIAEAFIARSEMNEMEAKLDLIGYREEHLEIKSPIDGVVLEGDLEDVEGASVQRGQMLFEIAPMDSLKLRLAIPEDDIAYTQEQMHVTAKLDGAPGRKLHGTLERITPRAKADTGHNHFVADASLAEDTPQETQTMLRPGMSGTAKVVGPNRAIGWILFHKAYRKITDMIEW